MTDRLSKACSGKSASQGGMNLQEIKALAITAGHSGKGSRDELLAAICKSNPPVRQNPPVPAPVRQNPPVPAQIIPPNPQPQVKVNLNPRLKSVCADQSKTAARGGMNLPEIKAIAIAAGHSGKGSREELLTFICKHYGSPAPAPAPVKIPAPAPAPVKIPAPAPAPVKIPKLPQLPRGQVTMNSKNWAENDKPTSRREREDLMGACGDKCFLVPNERKYPICNKKKTCKVDCNGLRAAYGVATIQLNSRSLEDKFRQNAVLARKNAIPIGVAQCGWE
jgi:hypothetical protein